MKKINLTVLITLAVIGLCHVPSMAITPEESTSADYLKNHGYSPEMVRLVDIQKNRINEKNTTPEDSSLKGKTVRTLKQWVRASDVTMSPDFGNDKIKY